MKTTDPTFWRDLASWAETERADARSDESRAYWHGTAHAWRIVARQLAAADATET